MSWLARSAKKPAPIPPGPQIANVAAPAPEPPSASVKRVLRAADEARRDVRDRVAEVNDLTEREVLGAAQNVNAIVEHTTATVGKLKSLAARFAGGTDHDGIARTIGAQTEMVRQFVEELIDLARAQAEASLGAQKIMADLGKATSAIDTLASEAKILALNSRIEAGRAGTGSRAFSVVSDEMRRLSGAVAATNTRVGELSSSVGSALTQVVKHAQHTRARIERFADESTVGSRALLQEVDALREETTHVLADSDQRIVQAVRFSHAALSNLQFQDVVAQGLQRLDGRMRDLQVELAKTFGVSETDSAIAAPAHSEVGGDKTVVHQAAGDIQLF